MLHKKLSVLLIAIALIGLLGGCCSNDDKMINEVNSISVGNKFYPSMLSNEIDVETINETEPYTKYKVYYRSLCKPSRWRYIYRRNVDSIIVAVYTK